MIKANKDPHRAQGMGLLYLLLTIVAGVVIFANIINIQWVHGKMWRAKAEQREDMVKSDPSRRGDIYSSDGKLLATTVTVCDLYIDLGSGACANDEQYKSSINEFCTMLSNGVTRHSAHYYRTKIDNERAKTRPSRCFLVQRNVPYQTWIELSQLPGWKNSVVRSVDHRSVVHYQREHIYGNLAQNTIGFRNSIASGGKYIGLEGYYDSILRGVDGVVNCHRLTRSTWLPDDPSNGSTFEVRTDDETVDTVVLQRRKDGQSIVSTIDTRYQDIADNALRRILQQYGGEAGCAVLMEMRTGYVLACANLTLDTATHTYLEMPDHNMVVSDVLEPGSTFKTVILTAALNDPTMKIDTSMLLPAGSKDFGGENCVIIDDHTINDRTSLSLREVIEHSSNVGMSDFGWQYYGNRRDTLQSLVRRIFPYQQLHPDLVAPEYRTSILDLNLSKRDFLGFCFGYSTLVTPLQILTFYNALGNNGRMVKPLFCRAIIDDHGNQHEVKPVIISKQAFSSNSAEVVRSILEGVVENGTGNNIRNNTYGIAGKTGTARHSYPHTGSYNASFAGFFPSENPRYTCLIIVKNVSGYGRQSAIAFKRIADCVVAMDRDLSEIKSMKVYRSFEKEYKNDTITPYILKANAENLTRAYRTLGLPFNFMGDSVGRWVYYKNVVDSERGHYENYNSSRGRVPDVTGMTIRDAVELLHERGLKAKVSGYGRVVTQVPSANETIGKNKTVALVLR